MAARAISGASAVLLIALLGLVGGGLAAVSGGRQATYRPVQLQSIELQSSGPVTSHLLITDGRGDRIGFVHGRVLNQLPGASVVFFFATGSGSAVTHPDPLYEVPSGRDYRIILTAGAAGASGRSNQSVTVLEPGFVAAVRHIVIAPRQQALVALAADGHSLVFTRPRGLVQPQFVLGNAAFHQFDYQWLVADRSRSSGAAVRVSLDDTHRTMSISTPGRYDLVMDRVLNEVSKFSAPRFTLGADLTAVFDYSRWQPGQPMPVLFYRHGQVVRRLRLNGTQSPAAAAAVAAFIPIESSPLSALPRHGSGLRTACDPVAACE